MHTLRTNFRLSVFILGVTFLPFAANSQFCPAQDRKPETPQIVSASDEGTAAIDGFTWPKGLVCELYAAEPDVANIVAIHRDYQGRLFVCETFRQEVGVEDNRRHAHWMDEELQAQTVQDRIDYIRKYIPEADKEYTEADDRIRLLVDKDNDGKPDRVTVFADTFNKLEMGTGAGVLSYQGNVYYTCIPDLFLLQDADDDGVADVRKSLHTGYGVRFAFRGHDLHGLIVGPDGRLYFSIGDRGYNISPEIKDPASGAVFRCELDGSHLEVVCTGLRNPQELAFDDFGNLFTGDNNSDSGDMARWVYLVPGSDSGWRMYYQYLTDRGPFNREKIWEPWSEESPAYIVPPIANISDGPSGLEYYPGTGFGDDFKGRFFLVDFRGNATVSGVRSFRAKQKGAFWSLEDSTQPFWNMLITDIDFGSNGKLYAADWVFGWNGENKGRIYTFHDPKHIDTDIVKEVERLLQEGMTDRATIELEPLLNHADQRVRREAQFELARRNDSKTLANVAKTSKHQLARVHALWGLSQIARVGNSDFDASELVQDLLRDNDFEIRAQAAQLAGDANLDLSSKIIPLLADENLRVRFYAAMALSKTGGAECIPALANMLAENKDADPIVRHGGIMLMKHFLKFGEGKSEVLNLAEHPSPSVRVALVVAIRKTLTDQIQISTNQTDRTDLELALRKMLGDNNRLVFVEAVRAIHDAPVNNVMAALAAKINQLESLLAGDIYDDVIVRRVLDANFRTGQMANAKALAKFSMNHKFEEERRVDAIQYLADWMTPPSRDAVLNDWRPIEMENRKLETAQAALMSQFANLVDEKEAVASVAISAAGILELQGIGDNMKNVVESDRFSDTTRAAALSSLTKTKFDGILPLLNSLESNFDKLPAKLAATATDLIATQSPDRGLKLVERILARDNEEQKLAQQMAISTLGRMRDESSAKKLVDSISAISESKFPENLRLDVLLAAENRTSQDVKNRLGEYRQRLAASDDPANAHIDTLFGGDEEAGKQIFIGKTEVSCVRCHEIDGNGGEVGPDLSGVAVKNDRKYLLDSLVNPNKVITEGFAQVKVQTIDGLMVTGIIQKETDVELRLLDADGKMIIIPQDDIEGIKPGLSAMPDDLVKLLTPTELRDLVEYLSNRKTPAEPKADVKHE